MNSPELNDITGSIIGAAFTVHNTLGSGFAEKVYENALAHELRKQGLAVLQQAPVTVYYDGVVVGEFFADLIVGDEVIVELKAVRALDPAHVSQCINYLKATGKPLCLLLNFGAAKLDIKRLAGKAMSVDL